MINEKKYEEIISNNSNRVKTIVKISIISFAIVFMLFYLKFDIVSLLLNITNVISILYQMTIGVIVHLFTDPTLQKYFLEIQIPMLQTIAIAFVGTAFGAIIGFVMALLSSETFVPKYVYTPMRVIASVIRSVPTLMYAAVFVVVFGSGAVSGTIAVVIFSFTIIAKMMYENIDEIDQAPVEALSASGASKIYVIRNAVLPQILPMFVSVVLYTFEINVRASMILGYVGAGGIGENLQSSYQNSDFTRIGLILLYTFVIVVIIDFVANKIRRKLI